MVQVVVGADLRWRSRESEYADFINRNSRGNLWLRGRDPQQMFNWLKAQGPTFNAILITALAAIAGAAAFSVVGWLGVAMLGLAVLFLAVRIDLNEDAVAALKGVGIALTVFGFAILFIGG